MPAASPDHHALKIITAVEPSPRFARRVVIQVDGKHAATVSTKLAEQLRLTVGMEWSQALAEQVQQAVQFDLALTLATKLIAKRPLSHARLEAKLRLKITDPELCQRVMLRLVELHLVDDLALGRDYLDELSRLHPAGLALWREKLLAKGITPEVVDRLLGEMETQSDPVALALAVAQKKMPRLRKLAPLLQQRRLYGLLARRGFEEEVIQQVVDRCVQDAPTTDPW